MFVRGEHLLASRESAYQHQQRRLRQMEIGKHRPHYMKAVARIDKQVGLASARHQAPIA